MTEEQESIIYDRKKNRCKDDAILNVLDAVFERPLFLGLQHLLFDEPAKSLPFFHLLKKPRSYEIEVVGSSRDGLMCARSFNCGDVDALLLSAVILDDSDEKSFEYRKDFPIYFHFPQPDSIGDLPKVDGKYLNPNYLRKLNPSLFPPKYKEYQYRLLTEIEHVSDVKCAITTTTPYSDPTYQPEFNPSAVDHRAHVTWFFEHIVFAYLLGLRNHKEMMFIRELLYGTDAELDNFETLTASLKHAVGDWKREIHRLIFGMYDLLYFDANYFQSLLKSAVDPEIFDRFRCDPTKVPHGEYSSDLVPAIRCHSWPRVASDFQSRARKWPSQTVIDEIVSSGFQVVARGCVVDPIPTKDFILSFSPSEAKLVDHLPPEAKSAYCLLKSCYKSAVGKEDESRKALKSYYFKTALFWVLERTGPVTWQAVNHLEGVRLIIDFLVDCLNGLNLPIYFVPQSNLFGGFSENDASTSISILMEIRRNPANFIKVLLDTEWEYTKITMVDDGSFEELRKDGGCFNVPDWEALLSLLMQAFARAGDYPTDEILDNPTTFFYSEEFRKRFIGDPFNTTPPCNIADIFGISEDQLDHVDIFVQSVSQNNMDLFNILDLDIGTEVSQYEENGIKEVIRRQYAKYDRAADQNFGKYFLAMTKLRLKFYANVFHLLTVKLLGACLLPATNAYKNKDVVYIINFLKLLTQKKNFDLDNLDDLLHYLLFFCHYTKQRHHTLSMTDQILRSIREFLQDAKNLMTIYFNPRLIGPLPLDLGNRMVNLLKECYPRQAKQTEQCCQM